MVDRSIRDSIGCFYVKPYGVRGRCCVTCFSGFSVDSFQLWALGLCGFVGAWLGISGDGVRVLCVELCRFFGLMVFVPRVCGCVCVFVVL